MLIACLLNPHAQTTITLASRATNLLRSTIASRRSNRPPSAGIAKRDGQAFQSGHSTKEENHRYPSGKSRSSSVRTFLPGSPPEAKAVRHQYVRCNRGPANRKECPGSTTVPFSSCYWGRTERASCRHGLVFRSASSSSVPVRSAHGRSRPISASKIANPAAYPLVGQNL